MAQRVSVLTRRSLLALAAGAGGVWPLSAASNFWERKPPEQWTPEEIDRLLTRSPWARAVSAEAPPGDTATGTGYPGGGGQTTGGQPYPPRTGTGAPRIGIGLPQIGGIPPIGGRTPRRTGDGGRRAITYPATVRWESARPVLDALKDGLPGAFAGQYVISVSGVPLYAGGATVGEEEDGTARPRPLDELRQSAALQPRNHAQADCRLVARRPSSGNVFLFGFDRAGFALEPSAGEVEFRARIGRALVKARFDLKAMLYRGALAV
jgi:hypothetical protein